MDIIFKNIVPIPLASIKHHTESIWGKEFILKKGSKVLLNASSGKGKSTFSSILFGIRNDYNGELLFDELNCNELTNNEWSDLRRNKLSIVFQDLQLFPSLTVEENLLIKNDLNKLFSAEEIKEMIFRLGIGDKWNQKCSLLSMGQQQRVAIVRSLLQPFEWLFLDEPFSHLDKENTSICLKLINERCNQLNAGFILTSLGSNHEFEYDQEIKL